MAVGDVGHQPGAGQDPLRAVAAGERAKSPSAAPNVISRMLTSNIGGAINRAPIDQRCRINIGCVEQLAKAF